MNDNNVLTVDWILILVRKLFSFYLNINFCLKTLYANTLAYSFDYIWRLVSLKLKKRRLPTLSLKRTHVFSNKLSPVKRPRNSLSLVNSSNPWWWKGLRTSGNPQGMCLWSDSSRPCDNRLAVLHNDEQPAGG